VLNALIFAAGLVDMGLLVVSVLGLRWRPAFLSLALLWAMTSTKARLDGLALAVLVCCLAAYEIRDGFKAAKAQAETE
jgi:hypothetical protein